MTDSIIFEKRRSIRKFKNKPVSHEQLKAIISAGVLAPSAKNRQQWGFIVLEGSIKNKIADLTEEIANRKQSASSSAIESCRAIREASAFILVCERTSLGFIYSDILSIGACMENMCLKAVELGLGSLWTCDIDIAGEEINMALGNSKRIFAGLAIGYPDENPAPRSRIPAEEITEWRK